jgi:uncharacterized phage infection (PIP) family protein YhgE
MNRFNFGLGALLLLTVVGCDLQALQNKQAELCAQLVSVESSIQRFKTIANDANIDQLKQAEAQLSEAFQQVRSTAETVPQANTQSPESVQQTPQQSPDPSKVGQTSQRIRDRVTQVEAAVNSMQSRLQCPVESPTSTPTPTPTAQ